MQRAWTFLCILFLAVWMAPIHAQEPESPGSEEEPDYEEEIPIESDWGGYTPPSLYSRGDQVVILSVGVTIPTVFTGNSGELLFSGVGQITVGGTGSISYNYFLTPGLFVGGEIQGMFSGTIGKHMLYIIPITARVGYQFVIKRFEFPIALGLGLAPQMLLDKNIVSFFLKPSASAYFRFNPDWSFGLNTTWWWIPQIPNDRTKTVYGNFFEASLSARYHF
ncbi:hypothetical protein FACS1894110_25340 [Spirochaetia bacterium]|nr:hypothetical protein FACS1894110_25340 [Spirochaetia bacterium]